MAFGIIRVRNLTRSDIPGTQKHNCREFGSDETPEHIHKPFMIDISGNRNINNAITERFLEAKVKEKSNSVVAVEYVVAISPEDMMKLQNGNYSERTILDFCAAFVEKQHGKENIIQSTFHYDESNPHAHIIATPIIEKTVAWKNRNGKGTKTENRLCARDFTGGPEKLRAMQTGYFNHLKSDEYFNSVFERFGVEFRRGVDARDKRARKEFYSKMTNHVMGDIRKEMFVSKKELLEGKITKEEYQEKQKASEMKITAISSNIEKKEQKDMEKYKEGLKWAKNDVKFGM